MELEWERIEKLRAPGSLSVALSHLGLFRINLIRREMRSDGSGAWVSIPLWLKGGHPFIDLIEKNEIGSELMRKFREELREESSRLQDTVIKSNSLGVCEVIVPLVLRGEKIGFLHAGSFVTESPVPGDFVLEERFKLLMLNADQKQWALDQWRLLPYFSIDKRAMILQMLQLMAKEMVQFLEETMVTRDREEAVTRHTFNQMVTANFHIKSILKKLPQIAASESPVLITGESGTGRELFAKMIHERSPRQKAAFKALHCSAVAENLLEAELLGYEKGAFIGAYTTKPGLFEVCHGGVLYLKEIGDLSLSMQLKILKLLQEKKFSRLGSNEVIEADVRVMASTQRNLKKLVQMGAFREDLYFLLSVMEIELPPLRQRREDVPLLAEHFLKQFSKVMKKEGLAWKEEAIQKLSTHTFPGNVREMRNEVERIVALKHANEFIEIADLSPRIVESISPVEEIEKGRTLKDLVDEYEKRIISESLAKYHWNKSRVAELFQITRQGLLKKITKYKLDKRKRA